MIEIRTLKNGTKKLRLKSMYKDFEKVLIRHSDKRINQYGYLYIIHYKSKKIFYEEITLPSGRVKKRWFVDGRNGKEKPKIIYSFYLDYGVRSAFNNDTEWEKSINFINWLINSGGFRKLVEYFVDRKLIKYV